MVAHYLLSSSFSLLSHFNSTIGTNPVNYGLFLFCSTSASLFRYPNPVVLINQFNVTLIKKDGCSFWFLRVNLFLWNLELNRISEYQFVFKALTVTHCVCVFFTNSFIFNRSDPESGLLSDTSLTTLVRVCVVWRFVDSDRNVKTWSIVSKSWLRILVRHNTS